MLPLGDSFKGHRINMNLCPSSGDMTAINWPPKLPLTKTVIYQGTERQYTTELEYEVGGDSLVDRAATLKAGTTCMLVCNRKYGCKRLMTVCRGSCVKIFQHKKQKQMQFKRAREETGSDDAARKKVKQEAARAHNDKVREGKAKAFGPRAKPDTQTECPHLIHGRCGRGAACKRRHDHVPMETIRATVCKLYRRAISGLCTAGTSHNINNCQYRSTTHRSPRAATE